MTGLPVQDDDDFAQAWDNMLAARGEITEGERIRRAYERIHCEQMTRPGLGGKRG